MLFNSFSFFVFLLVTLCVFYILPKRGRILFLTAASYYFYACFSINYVFFLLFSTCTIYAAGLLLEKKKRKSILISAIAVNLLFLFIFKYLTFFTASMQQALNLFHLPIELPIFKLLLPVGISFYTFQIIGYAADVYTGKARACHNFLSFALYVSFFPKIAQGPIETSGNFLKQLEAGRSFCYERFIRGFTLILTGLFKKLVIADRLAVLVNTVYGDLNTYSGLSYLFAAVFYSFQIYCDFSGYTDIARGTAKLFGYDLLENFKRPYMADSIRDFWKRWHISLTQWLTTYIYIPLGGNRKGYQRMLLNTLLVFLISGLWHGAAWTFVLWGLLHALFQIIGRLTRPFKDRLLQTCHIKKEGVLYKTGAVTVTFLLVTLAWIFFRAPTLADALQVCTGLFRPQAAFDLFGMGMRPAEMFLSLLLLFCLIAADILGERKDLSLWFSRRCTAVKWTVYLILLFSVILFGVYGDLSASSFLYFQF